MKEIYFDNAATTKTDKRVLKEMLPYFKGKYGNPNSMHNKGIEARQAIEEARQKVSNILNCSKEEIIFTGSGTESDNLAIFGYARKNRDKGKHIITTKIEHHAVSHCFERLSKEGFDVTFLDVDSEGFVFAEDLKKAIRNDTIFVSIIYANNEIGTIQNIKELAKICKEKGVAFHTDACQAANYCNIDVLDLGVDMMTLNGSKIYGPKGVGILYKKKGVEIEPILYGGGQENGIRSGTENVANIVGFAKALELVYEEKEKEIRKLTELRDYFINELLKIPDTKLNGPRENRLPNNVNVSFANIEGESLLLLLNEEGIFASTGSACSSKDLAPSHVVTAIGNSPEIAHSSMRFSLGKDITKKQIDIALGFIENFVKKLRKMSPLDFSIEELIMKNKKARECGE